MKFNAADLVSQILIIVGAINWGLIGFFKFDLVSTLFGGMDSLIARIIFALVGLAGLYTITFFFKKDENASETLE